MATEQQSTWRLTDEELEAIINSCFPPGRNEVVRTLEIARVITAAQARRLMKALGLAHHNLEAYNAPPGGFFAIPMSVWRQIQKEIGL